MKKFYLLAFALLTMSSLSAQIWSEDFEGDLSAWTSLDVDEDTYNWEIQTFTAHTGSQCATSASYINGLGALSPNNYLTSPAIDLIDETGALSLTWWTRAQDLGFPAEHYEVWISNDNTQAGIDAGDMIFEETLENFGDTYVERIVDISAYAGQVIFVTFIHNETTDQFRLLLDDISIFKPISDDLGTLAVVSPSNDDECMLTNDEPVTVTIFNYGGNAISNFEVSYSINGGTPVTATVTDEVAPASSIDFTFPDGADLSVLGEYEIAVSTNLGGDTNAANDETVSNIRSSDAVLTVHVMTDQTSGHSWDVIDLTTGDTVGTHGNYGWNEEFFDDVCIYSDRCYSFRYSANTEMGDNTFLELLLDGVTVAGDTNGTGVPVEFFIGAVGGGCAPNEAGLVRIDNKPYVEQNGNIVSGVVRNNGADPIASIEMSYAIDGGTPVVQEWTGLNVLSGSTLPFSFTEAADLPGVGEYELEVTIMTVNGEVDAVASNNSATQQLAVVSFLPDRGVVIEEGTGTWCGWCPRGAEAMDYLEAKYDNFYGIAVHNDDPMAVAAYDDSFSPFIGFAYPTIAMDREDLDFMPNDLASFPDMDVAFTRQTSVVAPATVNVKATIPEADSREVTIEISSEFVVPVSGDYRFNVVLTEDNVTGVTSGDDIWDQRNFYAGNNAGPMNGYENLPDPVPAADMVYHHVARAILGGFNGAANSVPTSVTRGEVVTYTFNYNVPTGYDMANMHVIGMLIDNSNGYIVNSGGTSEFEIVVGTEDLTNATNVKVFPNPFSQVTNVQLELAETHEVSMEVTNALGQRVAYREYGQLSGDQVLPFNARGFENGIYFIRVQLGNESIIRKVMLTK